MDSGKKEPASEGHSNSYVECKRLNMTQCDKCLFLASRWKNRISLCANVWLQLKAINRWLYSFVASYFFGRLGGGGWGATFFLVVGRCIVSTLCWINNMDGGDCFFVDSTKGSDGLNACLESMTLKRFSINARTWWNIGRKNSLIVR